MALVKGISRRVNVVESPDPHIFEQAIFILSNDAAGGGVIGLLGLVLTLV